MVPTLFRGTVIQTEEKGVEGRSVLSHSDLKSFRTNELAPVPVKKLGGLMPLKMNS